MAEKLSHVKRMEVPAETIRQHNLEEVATAVSENKESILKGIDLLESLNQSETLDMLTALVKHREDALANVMRELNKPEYAAPVENVTKLFQIAVKLDVDEMRYVADRMNHAVKEATASEATGKTSYMDLLKALKDPEINRSITMMLQFLRGMGKA
ncbi:DUF1641 domain-containing protein [Lentibacillus cibarius]|uniref:DUF1641 domain-containing protein n=1 Tax=Lentibacillus cibarius TaxID=2583219 RepID=A0A549YK00_9BACI|nr:DUF1641 domain-containing protein [Lentibacillus cibarius]TRM12213.1 DUF1641 domain-containing protein [Lentibacillus cibarius]